MKSVTVFMTLLTLLYNVEAQFGNEKILYILEHTPGLSTFASWCAELEYLYETKDSITVFAFNDTGYNTLPYEEKQVLQGLNKQDKKNYVRSFTVNQMYQIANLYDGQELESAMGRKLYINKKTVQTSWTTGTSKTFVNGGMIVREDLQASNGVIHVLERPLSPISNKRVLEFVESSTEFGTSKLTKLMYKLYKEYYSSAIAPLANEKKITFFMPDTVAMERVPEAKLDKLMALELSKIFRMHYIPKSVVFTNVVDNYQSFTSGNAQSQIIFHKMDEKVSVSSGGVTAQIIRGNITLDNGVIHIVDRMLGYVYYTAFEQMTRDAKQFEGWVKSATPEIKNMMSQKTKLNMFVPMDIAFQYARNLPGINLDGNMTLREMVLKLSIIRDGDLAVTKMGDGNYESRQRRISEWNSMKLVIYTDRNETYVNGGNVRAKIVRPDVGCIDGNLQYVDRLLGVPTMDIPTLIYYDDYLLLVYYEIVRIHLDEYLKDRNFDRTNLPPRGYEPTVYYGSSLGSQYSNNNNNNYGQNQGNGMFQYTTMVPNQYPTDYPNQPTQNPNNIPQHIVDEWQNQQNQYNQGNNPYGQGSNPYNQGSNNPYNQGNDPYNQGNNPYNQGNNPYNQGNNPYNQGSDPYGNQGSNPYGNQYNQGSNQYGNQQYKNQYGNQGGGYGNQQQQNRMSYWCDRTCGDSMWGCRFTFFVPNGTALENFYFRAHYAQSIIEDPCRFKYILRRLIIPHKYISLEEMEVSSQPEIYYADNGDMITIRKEGPNDVRILWGQQSARAIMWDLGATNGIVHIIDQILSDPDDQWIDVSGATSIVSSLVLIISLLLLSLKYIVH